MSPDEKRELSFRLRFACCLGLMVVGCGLALVLQSWAKLAGVVLMLGGFFLGALVIVEE